MFTAPGAPRGLGRPGWPGDRRGAPRRLARGLASDDAAVAGLLLAFGLWAVLLQLLLAVVPPG